MKMKKILIHSLVFSPDSVSTAYIYNDIALGLLKNGFDVVVLTSTPHYNIVESEIEKQKIKSEVDQAVLDVMNSSAFINGQPVRDFTAALSSYLSVKHVIPCANGTDALQIAMMALDLQPGDEVITPSFTYIASTEVIALLRLKPVFVEVDGQTFCMDPVSLRNAITPRTKAIVPVHLYGQAAPMEEIMKVAAEFGLYVIEDNAQAIGCDFKFGDGGTGTTYLILCA